jgi:CRISPR type III-A/MTUBE-associated protein Csm6
MTERLLFSPVGTTDPYRDDYEGPMLHIIRYFDPQVVYIFLTREMSDRSRQDDRYRRAIRKQAEVLGRDPAGMQIHIIESGIEDPSDFNGFSTSYQTEFREIDKNYPDAEVLINLSSGSPQMIATASLLASSHFLHKDYTCVQVVTHTGSSGSRTPYSLDFDETMIPQLLDNHPEAKNRCRKPDIQFFERIRARDQLLELVRQYDYGGAARLIDFYRRNYNPETIRWIKHFEKRILYQYREAGEILQTDDIRKFNPYPVESSLYRPVYEYYLGIQVKFLRQEWTDFLLRLSPLLTKLAQIFLVDHLHFELTDIIDCGSKKITRRLLERKNTSLLHYLDELYYYKFSDDYPSLKILLQISCYILDQKYSASDLLMPIFKSLECLRTAEIELRNHAAHEMIAVNDEFIRRNKDVPFNSFKELNLCLMDVIGRIAGTNLKPGWRDLPERFNEMIGQIIDQ